MRFSWILGTLLAIFVLGFTLIAFIISDKQLTEIDVVAVNDVVKTAEGNWGRISQETFRENESKLFFSIVDNSGEVIYESPGASFTDWNESIKNRDGLIDIKQDDEVVGKVVLKNNEQELMSQLKRELSQSIGLILSGLFLCSLIYLLYLYRTILFPFKQLQHFAKSVARGNLNQPLLMDKTNYFGAFTESFDLLRDELEEARQREHDSNRSKKELVATLSHDIKTPVASIKAVSELMLLQATDEKVIRQVNTIYSKAEQIDLLVTDMFHATLEELEQLNVSTTEVSSAVLVDMLEHVNYDDKIVYEPIPPCLVVMDPLRMQQVIDNVVSNSYKYAGTDILVTSSIQQNYLELQIMDFGPGVDEQDLPLVFNKYYRGKHVEGRNGSGLGLYISKYFMDHMDALISCHNREDGFTVILKIRLAE